MKIISLIATALLVMATPVSAQEVTAKTIQKAQYVTGAYCEARSPYAIGVGYSPNINYACRIALRECAVRTPYGYTCYVTNSYWY